MSRTLSLIENVFARACMLEQLGLNVEACRVWLSLARFEQLPDDFGEQVQVHLGQLYLLRKRYGKARRHLTAALSYQPSSAEYHHLLAQAIAADPKADDRRATYHYRRCLEVDPGNAEYLADFGLHALDLGMREEGLASLREAFELGHHDSGIVAKVIEGLDDEEEFAEATSKLRIAQFLKPNDPHWPALWDRHRFEQARAAQERDMRQRIFGTIDAPVLLPFDAGQALPRQQRLGRAVFRHDRPSHLPQAHLPDSRRVPG